MLPRDESSNPRLRRTLVVARFALALIGPFAPHLAAIPQHDSPPDAAHLRGTVDLRADSPNERLVKTGSFDISWAAGGVGSVDHVTIVDGRWDAECHAPNGCELWIQKIELNGAPALLLTDKLPVVPDSRTFAWSFDPTPSTSLLVLDAMSGAALRDIELLGDSDRGFVYSDDLMPSAGRCETLGTRLTSPVALPKDAVSAHRSAAGRLYFVRAKGYAWSSVLVDSMHAGSRLVCLEPAGKLELKLRAAGRPQATSGQAWISLWRVSGGATIRIASRIVERNSGPIEIDGVPAGEIVVGISSKGEMLRTASAERTSRVKIAARQTTVAELECGSELASPPILARVVCELDFPSELSPAGGIQQLLLVSAATDREYTPDPNSLCNRGAEPGRTRLLPLFVDVPPGEYFLAGDSPPVVMHVQVWTSAVHVSKRIEDCGTVRLRASENAGPKPDLLEWTMYGADGETSLPMPAVFDKDTKEWIVRAPVGKVALTAILANPETVGQQDLVVAAGESRAELKLVWEHRARIRLLDAGVPVLLPPAWWESAVVSTAAGARVRQAKAPRTVVQEIAGNGEILGAHPGDVIQLPVPAGFEPLAPIRIPDDGFAKDADVKIELVRKKW